MQGMQGIGHLRAPAHKEDMQGMPRCSICVICPQLVIRMSERSEGSCDASKVSSCLANFGSLFCNLVTLVKVSAAAAATSAAASAAASLPPTAASPLLVPCANPYQHTCLHLHLHLLHFYLLLCHASLLVPLGVLLCGRTLYRLVRWRSRRGMQSTDGRDKQGGGGHACHDASSRLSCTPHTHHARRRHRPCHRAHVGTRAHSSQQRATNS